MCTSGVTPGYRFTVQGVGATGKFGEVGFIGVLISFPRYTIHHVSAPKLG